MTEWDVIIVGAGSAGCVLAGQLAEAGSGSILVIEAGPRDRSPWIHLPIGYGKTFYHPRLNWMYRTTAQSELDGREIYQPRGKVVGGSSSINAMVYARGQQEDFDEWERLGNPGWGWAEVLAAYRRMEDHALGTSPWHGAGGPLHVTDIEAQAHPLTALFVKAAGEAGLAFNPDLNGATSAGAGYYQITTRGGRRESSARAFLHPARRRGRVKLETEALVTRILFEGRRAVGLEVRRGGETLLYRARREIVLAGGAFNTPQLLQLSGIGPANLLTRHGITPLQDLPAVGRNLQDHLCYDHVYRSKLPSLNGALLSWPGRIGMALNYLLGRRGPLSLSVNQGGGFFRTRPELPRPDMQLYFSPLSYERALPGVRALMKPDPFAGFSLSVSPCRPLSRGHVAIRSPDPHAPPEISPNYLAEPEDVRVLMAGARFLHRLAATPTFASLIEAEIRPGPDAVDEERHLTAIRQNAYSVFHPCGTCRMGPDPRSAVVDARLRVHGIENLRIADASIFPTIPSGNINAPAMMVGQRAAELMRDSTREASAS
ncbi:GMC family oxidoreductase [Bosea sp. BH3]|uniref:GMC family oxidoreductase n=1 Tax=Bosea sp. BH3 TaxID=2871701 RepID=UPI0021CB62D4|nr:GMC family oxidoreductase N-terminal domain-containing protein [Bosea sp. BH3]MCU4178360.1 GMC family oxidoreductase N-terminal domain-containing protein [Bosea sp. BH3]